MRLAECFYHDAKEAARFSDELSGATMSSTDMKDSSLALNSLGHVSSAVSWTSFLPMGAVVCVILGVTCLLPVLRHLRGYWTACLLWTVLTGVSLTCAFLQPNWSSLDGWLNTTLAHTLPGRHHVRLTVHCGLNDLHAILTSQKQPAGINEFYHWHAFAWPSQSDDMDGMMRTALQGGLPWPMISALEAVVSSAGHQLSHAGYLTSWVLTAAVYSWAVGVWLVLVEKAIVRPITSRAIAMTGIFMVAAAFVYASHLPQHAVKVHFEDGHQMALKLAWCFWIVVGSGLANVTLGVWLILGEYFQPITSARSNATGGVTRGQVIDLNWLCRARKLRKYHASHVSLNIPLNHLSSQNRMTNNNCDSVVNGPTSECTGGLRIRQNSSPWKTPGSMPRRCIVSLNMNDSSSSTLDQAVGQKHAGNDDKTATTGIEPVFGAGASNESITTFGIGVAIKSAKQSQTIAEDKAEANMESRARRGFETYKAKIAEPDNEKNLVLGVRESDASEIPLNMISCVSSESQLASVVPRRESVRCLDNSGGDTRFSDPDGYSMTIIEPVSFDIQVTDSSDLE